MTNKTYCLVGKGRDLGQAWGPVPTGSSRSPSLGLKTNPPVSPLNRGGKNDAPPARRFFHNPRKAGLTKIRREAYKETHVRKLWR